MKKDNDLLLFKKTGFFDEKDAALKHLRYADEILTSEGVDYCLMFGTLLGLLRHQDYIPWDDDLDIIIFDIKDFEKRCLKKFEEKGYKILQDIRFTNRKIPFFKTKQNCGYRIYHENGKNIQGVSWKFPWLGIWEANIKDKLMILPPEKFIYNIKDFFPLQRKGFQDFSVFIPNNPEKILNHYFGNDDWMDFCVPSTLDHRNYRPTEFPTIKRPLKDVLEYLNT